MSAKRVMQKDSISTKHQQRIQFLQKLREGISVTQIATDYKICKHAVMGVKRIADKINLLTKKYSNETQYKILDEQLYNWLLERKILEDTIPDALLKDKVHEFANEFSGPSTDRERRNWLRGFKKRYTILLKSQNVPESSQNFVPRNEKDAEKFIQKFTQRLKQENISKDNIYTMVKMDLTWKYLFRKYLFRYIPSHEDKKKVDIKKKLKNDSLTFMFCTNATGSHKLSPFCNYKHQEALKYLKNTSSLVSKSQRNKLKDQEIFADWYNNYFTKSVREHQQKTNVSGKTLLLIKNCKKFLPKENMKDDSFKILFLPRCAIRILQPVDQRIINEIKRNFQRAFKDFCKSYDIENYVKATCESWTNATSARIKDLWKRHFKSNLQTKQDNVTEEDIAVKEIPETLRFCRKAKREKRQKQQENTVSAENNGRIENTESIEENIEAEGDNSTADLHKLKKLIVKNILQGNPDEKPPEVFTSYAKVEAERRQEQQEDIKSIAETIQRENTPMEILKYDIMKQRVSPDNLTEYLNFYREAEGEKHQGQLENTKKIEDNTQRENIPEILKMMYDIMEKRVLPDNLTDYFNSYGKIKGAERSE
ncbi:jerky-like protein [Lasius niger]|uniref:Jerky-like protein n=1 Tax=Lasius niger TaxID=67767 RepID=A0A0J7KUG5_LASNI|nr:jerky-like protein [Lasius niger]